MNQQTEPAGLAAVRQHLRDTFHDWVDSDHWLDDAIGSWVEHRDAGRIVHDILGFDDGPVYEFQANLQQLDPQPDHGLDIG